jgi:hypothetical protein
MTLIEIRLQRKRLASVQVSQLIADNLSKAWGVSQRLIPTGERSGLLTRIATESVSLCTRMKS